jgi:hypothetical protein
MSGKQSRSVHLALAWLKRHPGETAAAASRYGVTVKTLRIALHAAGRSAEVAPVGRPRKATGVNLSPVHEEQTP